MQFRCRVCGGEAPLALVSCCGDCFGPLEVTFPPVKPLPEEFSSRPQTLWRYLEWLPLEQPGPQSLALARTPMIRAERLGEALGLRSVWLKDEGRNPTGSFKDRLVAVALTRAREFGLTTVVCASTGNLARSVLTLAPLLGLTAHVLVPESSAGPGVIAVRGTYDEANRLAIQIGEERGWGVVNSTLHPFYAEGGKTVGHEIAEQLGRLPDVVVCCMAGGGLLGQIHRGLHEMASAGIVPAGAVKMVGVQPSGCAPIVRAFKEGRPEPIPVRTPTTIVHSLAVGDPGDGFFALQLMRETGGAAEDVSDEEAQAGVALLASTEGIDAELAAGVTVAATRKLVRQGQLSPDAQVVLVLTGRANTTAVTGPPLAVIDPTRDACHRLL